MSCLYSGSSVIKINNDLVTTIARTQPSQHKENKLQQGMIESTVINVIVLTVNVRQRLTMCEHKPVVVQHTQKEVLSLLTLPAAKKIYMEEE